MSASHTMKKRVALLLAFATWILAVWFGAALLLRKAETPGVMAKAPSAWPGRSVVQRTAARPVMLLFVHPYCACSRSSIGELASIMARNQGKLDAWVFFYLPESEAPSWAETDLWRRAEEIPGVRVVVDAGARERRAFGASTSGQAILYDASGHLIFSGGITSSRGHFGDNDGSGTIASLLSGKSPQRRVTPVFGCSLRGAGEVN